MRPRLRPHRWLARLGALIMLGWALAGVAADKPHIVYILADDLGWKDVGFHGGKIATPHLDKLAESGATLNAFYAQPYSSQTRAALMTGRYPMRYGLQTLSILPRSQFGLPTDERTLAQALKEAGYRTALIGKWQLGHAKPEYWPTRRGFDYFYGSLSGSTGLRVSKTGKNDWRRGDQPVKEEGLVTPLLAKDAVSVIAKHDAAAPLLLCLWLASPAAEASESEPGYAAGVAAVDDAVGQVVSALEKKGMRANTFIVFHSDNGGALPMKYATGDGDVKKAAADNDIYREGKGSLYEGGVRVVALASWPGKIKEKSVVTRLLHATDMYATLLTLAGAKLDQPKKPDGLDAWATLAEAQLSPRQEILLNVDDFGGALRVGEWKLIVRAALPSKYELFDIANDPEEANNQADTYPDRVKQMLAKLNAYAYDMAPAKYLEEFAKGAGSDAPLFWGHNSPRR